MGKKPYWFGRTSVGNSRGCFGFLSWSCYGARKRLQVWIIGEGPLEDELKTQSKEFKLETLIQFIGYRDNVDRYLFASDLFVLPSRYEGMSISLLEAMASGLPALVSDIPGNKEWINPGENGWLFKDSEAGSLADGMVSAVRSKSELATLGASGRRLAESRADWGKNKQLLEGAYQSAIRGIDGDD